MMWSSREKTSTRLHLIQGEKAYTKSIQSIYFNAIRAGRPKS
jgi:hypothetical protein